LLFVSPVSRLHASNPAAYLRVITAQISERRLMPRQQIFIFTLLAMLAFAGNSLLCRVALKHTTIDAASFTTVRMIAGALTLWLIVSLRDGVTARAGNWPSALALFAYAAAFSFAYIKLPAAVGALLLFGSVQTTMISYGLVKGERMALSQTLGFIVACCGLVALLLPGLSAPPLTEATLMIAAGIAWGVYSLRGKGSGDATQVTAGNFLRASLFSIMLSVLMFTRASLDSAGMIYAILSGALTSGVGYALWYTALPHLRATSAATIQLSVPVIAAAGGIIFLAEPITLRFFISSIAILGGVAMVVLHKHPHK
jgi:drug/metabolite transporter (DMT)-like permease